MSEGHAMREETPEGVKFRTVRRMRLKTVFSEVPCFMCPVRRPHYHPRLPERRTCDASCLPLHLLFVVGRCLSLHLWFSWFDV